MKDLAHYAASGSVPTGDGAELLANHLRQRAAMLRESVAVADRNNRRYVNPGDCENAEAEAAAIDALLADVRGQRTRRALENARSIMRIVSDAAEDEGDRTYFGSSNHADWLRECAQETEAFLFGIDTAPRTTTASAVGTKAAGRSAPKPCPCGKPALPAASICLDCADASLANQDGKEGES